MDGKFLWALEVKAIKGLLDAGKQFAFKVGKPSADDIAIDVENLIEVEVQQDFMICPVIFPPAAISFMRVGSPERIFSSISWQTFPPPA